MSADPKHDISNLTSAILEFAKRQPGSIREYEKGERIINEGEPADECFLVTSGALSILVKDGGANSETQVALRFRGDLVGETAFLQQHARRTASVVIASDKATVVRLSRGDVFDLVRHNPGLHDVVTLLWELGATRKNETLQVVTGQIKVQNRLMSVFVGDIHNFSALGEAVWEEHANAFLFDFIEQAMELSLRHGGSFEDQGDGFKAVFARQTHAMDSAKCAQEIAVAFKHLRQSWCAVNGAFDNIGLGIGICADFMSIRTRDGSRRTEGRVLGHAINIASALSKHRQAPNDVDVFINENAKALIASGQFSVSSSKQQWLEKLGRILPIYRLTPMTGESSDAGPIVSMAATGMLPTIDSEISVLFLASDPTDASRLRLSEEAREIEEKLRLSKHRDRFVFHQRSAARPSDLSQALLDFEPHIVHFSGHGSEFGELCLEDKVGKTQPVSPDALSALFGEFTSQVRCVVLNACYSELQADAIVKHIDHVIGMDDAISDGAAIAFSVGFYQGLGAGKSIEEAYRLGSIQIGLEGIDDERSTPVFKERTRG